MVEGYERRNEKAGGRQEGYAETLALSIKSGTLHP